MKYYNSKIIKGTSVAVIRPKVEEELKKQGFGVLTEIDIQAVMKKKLGKDYLPHLILGACNPVFADKVISLEPTISTLLPCNITLRGLINGNVEIAVVNPSATMGAIANDDLEFLASKVQEKLMNVLNNI